jgi:hypothetical protein
MALAWLLVLIPSSDRAVRAPSARRLGSGPTAAVYGVFYLAVLDTAYRPYLFLHYVSFHKSAPAGRSPSAAGGARIAVELPILAHELTVDQRTIRRRAVAGLLPLTDETDSFARRGVGHSHEMGLSLRYSATALRSADQPPNT